MSEEETSAPALTILSALDDPNLFGSHFRGDTWGAWRVFLKSLFALSFDKGELETYQKHTERKDPPAKPAKEGWVIVGRRGGKSRISALVAVWLACFRDYRPYLAPGERGTLMVLAADRRQARTVMRYIGGFFDTIPLLSQMVERRDTESLHLNNRVSIEVHTGSFRAIRGYTCIGCIADEIAFWRSDDYSANPDIEIINGLRPGMSTIPGSLLLAISSPYARRGALWRAYRSHYGKDGDPILLWRGDTLSMNEAVDPAIIEAAYEADPVAAGAEYGAEFRKDLESYVDREVVDACVQLGLHEIPPGTESYTCFIDPAGGSGGDSFTLAIGHLQDDVKVLDCLRERRPPFSPDQVTAEYAELMKSYGCHRAFGDRFAGGWPVERFREHGVNYEQSAKPKSELYAALLPDLNSGRVQLLDHPRLIGQLCSLERRTSRGGRDSVDHEPGSHDDVSNVLAGLAQHLRQQSRVWVL